MERDLKVLTLIDFQISICLLMFAGMTNDIVLAWIHERVPETAPLPDLFFSLTPHFPKALAASEYLIIVSTVMMLAVCFLHRHRWILLRRVFCMLALLYLSRCVCMLVTQVPVADPTYFCSTAAVQRCRFEYIRKAYLLRGLYIHNVLHGRKGINFIDSPRRFWQLHLVVWLVSASGILCILLSRGHYTVDVVIAYFVTTRMFWLYHTMANNPELKVDEQECWFPLFRYMESNVAPSVPRQFEWPFAWPRFFKSASIGNGGRFRS
ncbi:PAP2 C domain containing protein [Trichuris trichiura]|uniref:PAP2 C domain containing protein n=1 Tax=Trichuris trichiura TaxID=36087 RepID=A0A077Z5M7_TRITR|nr:PAP2 C domain containing protein [Trichuris trichiura]